MAKAPISEEEVMEVAEKARTSFLQEHTESDDFDHRDLQRVRSDLEFVAKFARQQRGNHDNAINQMVEALKWRKKLGINDIQYEDIEETLWRSGMAYTHGLDKNGNHIVILNIRLHRKDSKKSQSLQRWIAFCFETHRRAFPKGRICMIFDMTACGLSQMDMELIRFIVNCFKIYFPDLLAILLVYNMPWILQAAWKIVQSWLSEGAVAKVKFVNSETIQEYVSSEQLLVNFGGSDTWQFDYEREKEVMLKQLREVLEREAEGDGEGEEEGKGEGEGEGKGKGEGEGEGKGEGGTVENRMLRSSEFHSSDMEQNPSGESVEGVSEEDRGSEPGGQRGADCQEKAPQRGEEGSEDNRKVRFSANLPPTRQSRYGREDEVEEGRRKMTSPANQQLLKGSAASHGFRRRQVHKLMSLQTDQRNQRSLDTAENDLTTSVGQSSSEPVLPLPHIQLSPSNELMFVGSRDSELLCTLSLSNTSHNAAVFKIKTTAPRRYKVRPNLALVQPQSVTKVQVLLVPGPPSEAISEDKFLVQLYSFSASVSVPSQNQLLSFWRGLSDDDITEHRMRCRWLKEGTPSLVSQAHPSPISLISPTLSSSPSSPPSPTSPSDIKSQRDLRVIGDKLDRLIKANQDMSKKVQDLRYLVILLLVLTLILLTSSLAYY